MELAYCRRRPRGVRERHRGPAPRDLLDRHLFILDGRPLVFVFVDLVFVELDLDLDLVVDLVFVVDLDFVVHLFLLVERVRLRAGPDPRRPFRRHRRK
jgi:hypothetical protein